VLLNVIVQVTARHGSIASTYMSVLTPRRSHRSDPLLIQPRYIGSHQDEDVGGVGAAGTRALESTWRRSSSANGQAILREGSVARTAERLHLSQPATSHALSRLRRRLKDQLFVRTPTGMSPTPRAERLA
jgi:Bacterial regulatory helix-turn-helix protein, lysR family